MSEKSTNELRAEIRALRDKRDASTDQAERARLLAEMNRLQDEIVERSLDAGETALGAAKGAEKQLDKELTRESHDAVSALGRTARKLGDAAGGGGQDGNG